MKPKWIMSGLLIGLASACATPMSMRAPASIKGGEIGSRPTDGTVVDQPIGHLIAVKRTFKVNLEECRTHFIGRSATDVRGECTVRKFIPAGENIPVRQVDVNQGTFVYERKADERRNRRRGLDKEGTYARNVTIRANIDGYTIIPPFLTSWSFEEGIISEAIAALPNQEVSLIVYTIAQ